jgi:hypothetical protein
MFILLVCSELIAGGSVLAFDVQDVRFGVLALLVLQVIERVTVAVIQR